MARRHRRDLSVFESSCHLLTCLPHTAEASHCPFNCWTSSREAVKTNLYCLWFDPTGNRTRVYRFSSRLSIHSTTDRLSSKTFRSSSQLSCHLPTCLPHTAEASHCSFNCWTSSREAVKTNLYCLWFDPTGNRTRVYRFSSRRSIHSTTDRLSWATRNIVMNPILENIMQLNLFRRTENKNFENTLAIFFT